MPKSADKSNSISRPKAFARLFPAKSFNRPGEYGKPDIDGGQANGFAIVNHPALKGRSIFISSLPFVKGLMKEHKISRKNHVNLLVTKKFSEPVPERSFPAGEGLKIFRVRLKKLNKMIEGDILINCARGRNRSPVAALIYMVDLGIPYHEAYESLMAAMRVRIPDFKLNPYDNYTASLAQLEQQSLMRETAKSGRTRAFSL